MKKLIGLIAVYASLVLLAATVFAQTAAPQGECTEEGKAALYTDFTTFRTTDSGKAYEAGKKYLACSQGEDQYTAYLKKWVTAYEKENRKIKMVPMLYGEKKYAEALGLGKEILADEPENLRVIIDQGYGSYLAAVSLKNESYNTDALNFARKAIQMIESGKAPASWAPFKGKDDTLAYLYDVVGRLTMKDNPAAALTAFLKKAQFETDLKKDPWTYYFIAAAYESGPYTKLSADYKACCEGKDETPQSKLLLENINQVVDRMVDAYARAVALAGDPKYATNKKQWMEDLSTWYKFRHNQSDAGLNELIASVLSKPLPPEPTPLTSLPASASTTIAPATASPTVTTTGMPATTTTPAAGAPKPAASTASTTTPPKPAASTASTTTPAKPAASTASSTTAAKPKPRNNHAATQSNQRRH
jgi:hypothetical protein